MKVLLIIWIHYSSFMAHQSHTGLTMETFDSVQECEIAGSKVRQIVGAQSKTIDEFTINCEIIKDGSK